MTATLARPILRDPAFGRLWFIQASTQVGGNMALYALTILVFATTRSNSAVSALVMSFLIPTILLSAVAGVLVDRLDVRWALIGPNTIRTLLTLGLALAGANVAMLLLLNLGISLTTVVLTPAEASMIPRIVPKAQLETAMGVFNLTLQASFAVGFAFLGPLLVAVADRRSCSASSPSSTAPRRSPRSSCRRHRRCRSSRGSALVRSMSRHASSAKV